MVEGSLRQQRLDEIAAREAAATPGEWKVYDLNEGDGHGRPFWQVSNDAFWDDSGGDDEWLAIELHTGHKADAEFVAHAKDDIRFLLDAVAAARQETADRIADAIEATYRAKDFDYFYENCARIARETGGVSHAE